MHRKHHILPEFYLREFVDPTCTAPEPYVWVGDRRTGSVRARAPKNAAHAPHYYAFENDDGIDATTFEHALGIFESDAAPAYRRMLQVTPEQVSQVVSIELARFVTLLAMRTPWFRRWLARRWHEVLCDVAFGNEAVPEEQTSLFEVFYPRTGQVERVLLNAALERVRNGWVGRPTQNHFLEGIKRNFGAFQSHLGALRWWLVITEEDCLMTSDRPVVWVVPGYEPLSDLIEALRLDAVEVTIPLSRRCAWFGTREPAVEARITAREINARTFHFAEQFVISPRRFEFTKQI